MIELFDTSALILAARVRSVGEILADAVAADELALSEPVLLEYLNGARNSEEYDRFERGLRAARLVRTTPEDWDRALEVHRSLAQTGPGHQRSVRLPDLIIAAVGERNGLSLVHYDADYDRIAAVTGQPTRWVAPLGSI